jgi:ectoine hydroxylase-related dioxygenase (phytanoyl-CoA dioxygenase family)
MRWQLSSDGFEVRTNVLSADRVAALTSSLVSLEARHGLRNLLRDCPAIEALARELTKVVIPVLGKAAFPVRGLFFDKMHGANWQVDWHQDLSIAVAERIETPGFKGWSVKQGVLHVQPPASVLEQMLTLRIHLDDCGPGNGPLRVLPGSHRHGRLDDAQIESCKRSGGEVTCIVPAGGTLLMRPLLLHASSPAKSPRHRRVIHLEYASESLPNGLRWFEQVLARVS